MPFPGQVLAAGRPYSFRCKNHDGRHADESATTIHCDAETGVHLWIGLLIPEGEEAVVDSATWALRRRPAAGQTVVPVERGARAAGVDGVRGDEVRAQVNGSTGRGVAR
jgi:hypothetical protein